MRIKSLVVLVLTFAAGFLAARALPLASAVHAAEANTRVFELRTYTAPEGKLTDLQARFRNHTVALFQKHGITNVGYWIPQDAPLAPNTLVYMLAYPNRDEAKKRWAAFQADPEWQKARTESELQGRLTTKVESVFMAPTDFSPMK
jgi:NIPSNAP